MKVATSVKITAGAVGILLAGFLGWEILHHESIETTEARHSLNSSHSLAVESSSKQSEKSKSKQSEESKDVPSFQTKSSAPTNSTESKSKTGDEVGGTRESEDNLFLSDKGLQGEKAEELSPELKRKVETYTELAKLLPIAKWEFEVMVTFPHGDANRTPEQRAFIQEAAERNTLGRILALVEPVMGPIGPPAIHRDERGVIQQVNFGPLFTQVAKYMGKELPFDENSDYFSAKDYQGGMGGWE